MPMGTACADWTGIDGVRTLLLGLVPFSQPATLARFFFRLMVTGIVGLLLASVH
jgi:quaternary ammonium compound-resistance protein SugE